jgi:excisionase family DNA binding protein
MLTDKEVPKLLTTRELARLTTIPYWRVLQLIAAGKGPPFLKIGNTYRFPQDGVVDWIFKESSDSREE